MQEERGTTLAEGCGSGYQTVMVPRAVRQKGNRYFALNVLLSRSSGRLAVSYYLGLNKLGFNIVLSRKESCQDIQFVLCWMTRRAR